MSDDGGEACASCIGCIGFFLMPVYVSGYVVAANMVWQQTHSIIKTTLYSLGSWITVIL